MSIVGHKTESIYRRNAIVDEAMKREAAARLDAWVTTPSRHGRVYHDVAAPTPAR